ncbi:MAG: glycosyltransferase family 2 protein [Clostridia bacterium]|nr:glycosyltransferase family 2 protein [Clostridia bacterium]
MKRLISLIVPCYNEEEALPHFLREVSRVAEEMKENAEFEILFIDDGSKDNTLAVLRQFAKDDSRVKYLAFSRNFGKEAAMYAGLCNAKGDYVAVMDADLQDPPSLLPQMFSILESGEYDSVATRRITRAGEPKLRSFFARMFYRVINRISDADIVDGARDYRLMRREMVKAIVAMSERNRFSKGIFGWVGFRTYWLPYENVSRVAGKSKWSFWKLFRYSVDGFVNFSQAPLTISAIVGGGFTVLSVVAIIFIIVRKLCFGGSSVDGWASLVCIIAFVSGLQLACLGIIGQYLSKTYLEVKQRPHYILKETNDEDAEQIR